MFGWKSFASSSICYEMLSISKIELPPYLDVFYGQSQRTIFDIALKILYSFQDQSHGCKTR